MMDFATNQKFSQGRDYTLLLYERDKESFESLAQKLLNNIDSGDSMCAPSAKMSKPNSMRS